MPTERDVGAQDQIADEVRKCDEKEPPGPPLPVRPQRSQLDHRQIEDDEEREELDDLPDWNEKKQEHGRVIVSDRTAERNRQARRGRLFPSQSAR